MKHLYYIKARNTFTDDVITIKLLSDDYIIVDIRSKGSYTTYDVKFNYADEQLRQDILNMLKYLEDKLGYQENTKDSKIFIEYASPLYSDTTYKYIESIFICCRAIHIMKKEQKNIDDFKNLVKESKHATDI